jgi:integrase
MASIYKRNQDKHNRRTAWYIGYKDHTGRQRTVKGYTDKGETERYAAKLEEDARLIRDGLKAPDEDARIKAKKAPIDTMVEEFKLHLERRDITDKQIYETVSRLKKVVAGAKIRNISDINAIKIQEYLKGLRDSGRSRQTSNHYFRAIQQFTLWLVRTRKLVENPLSEMRKLNTQVDRRHDRRALSDEEFSRLVEAAESGKPDQTIPGPDRAMLYVLAALTGYRRSELASLTPSSFDLDGDPPTATVSASFSKRKRIDTQVLHPLLVERLRKWLVDKALPPNAILFPVSDKVPGGVDRRTSEMMMNDLAAAREKWINEGKTDKEKKLRQQSDFLKYKDSQNRFADFHANRHTFITNLSKAKVSPKIAQELARHSDIRLTLGIYTHTNLDEKTRAVGSLPKPWEYIGSKPEAEAGTDSHDATQSKQASSSKRSAKNIRNTKEKAAICATCHSTSLDAAGLQKSDSEGRPRLWRPSPLPGEHSCVAEAQRTELLRCLIFELYYPVGFANELGPALHTIHSIGVDRLPSWTQWLLAKLHVRLSRSPVSLLRIAIDASQYAVRPSRQSTLSPRDNVVNRELFAARLLSTVLATHFVTLEYVSATEGNRLRRHRIELSQCDDFRNTDALAYRLDERLVSIRYHSAPIAPVIQLVVDRVDDLGRIVP